MTDRREELSFDIIIDMTAEDYVPPENSTDWLIMHPEDALQWVATGKFDVGPEEPIFPWWKSETANESEAYEASGRLELAEELLCHAISNGRVRLVQVWNSHPHSLAITDLPQLALLNPEKLAGCIVEWSREDIDLSIIVQLPAGEGDDDNDDNWVEIKGCYFLWSEISRLRPDRRDEQKPKLPQSSDWTMSVIPSSHGLPFARGILPQKASQGARRGRKPRRYGGPIATFIARAVREGLDQAAREKDETLGYWLLEEFTAHGDLNPPDIRNAAADARGALDAWIKVVAQYRTD